MYQEMAKTATESKQSDIEKQTDQGRSNPWLVNLENMRSSIFFSFSNYLGFTFMRLC